MPLQLETYKANRDAELIKLCARAVQASSPVTFNSIGYPERIIDNSQIVWFADAMHEDEGQPEAVFADDFYVTDEEAELVNEVADIVEALTEKQFGIRVRPWASLLFCLNMFRLVKAMSNFAGEDLPVYEIGPGSGYLGALLVRSGHRYVATDIAEGFYLWQSRMLEAMAEGDFCELAEERVNGTIVDPGTKVVHVPWWIHGSYYRTKCPFNASLVVCDHAFGEMSNFGLKYTIAASKDILVGSGPRALLTTSIGFPHINKLNEVITQFYRGGFVPLIAQGPLVFVPEKSDLGAMGVRLEDLKEEIRSPGSKREIDQQLLKIGDDPNYYFKDKGHKLTAAKSVFPINWEHAPLDYPFIEYIGDPVPSTSDS